MKKKINQIGSKGTTTVKHSVTGETLRMELDDPRYKSGEYVGVTKETVTVKNKDGVYKKVPITDKDYKQGNLVHMSKGKVPVRDGKGRTFTVDINHPDLLNGTLKHVKTGTVPVKDKNGIIYNVSTSDPRYKKGELVSIWKGRKHTEETKTKMSISASKVKQGKQNPQYGKTWVYNTNERINMRIDKEILDTYLKENPDWKRGRKMEFYK